MAAFLSIYLLTAWYHPQSLFEKSKGQDIEEQEFTKVDEQRSDEDNAAFWLFK